MIRLLCIILLFISVSANAEDDTFIVSKIINGKSFITSLGDTVRLASIEAPNVQEENTPYRYGRPGEPLGEEAKQALASLILNKKIRIDYNPGKRDRHNRLLGQVYDEKGRWIQGEMLKQGWVMTYSFNDDSSDMLNKMLADEKEARRKKIGLWANPYYRVITPQEAPEFVNRFRHCCELF